MNEESADIKNEGAAICVSYQKEHSQRRASAAQSVPVKRSLITTAQLPSVLFFWKIK